MTFRDRVTWAALKLAAERAEQELNERRDWVPLVGSGAYAAGLTGVGGLVGGLPGALVGLAAGGLTAPQVHERLSKERKRKRKREDQEGLRLFDEDESPLLDVAPLVLGG